MAICFPTDTACKRRNDCRNKCRGWFGAQPDLERACRNSCKSNAWLTKDEFLCSGNWIEQQIVMAAYGYDPCPNTGAELDDFFDPLQDRIREDREVRKYKDILVIGGVLIGLALIILYVIAK